MELFSEIAMESRMAMEEARAKQFERLRKAYSGGSARDPEDREVWAEQERESEAQGRKQGSITEQVRKETGGAWDRLRHGEKHSTGKPVSLPLAHF